MQSVQREAWQNVVAILVSKAQVSSFCLELAKKLDMRYNSPPLPVDLAIVNHRSQDGTCTGTDNDENPELERLRLGRTTTEDNAAFVKDIVALFENKKDK